MLHESQLMNNACDSAMKNMMMMMTTTNQGWNPEWLAATDLSAPVPVDMNTLKSVDFIMEKCDEDKVMAHDIDDLSLVFEELANAEDQEAIIDFIDDEPALLKFMVNEKENHEQDNQNEQSFGVEKSNQSWIDDLEQDAMNVDEISEVFDQILAENDQPECVEAQEEYEEEDIDEEEDEDEVECLGSVMPPSKFVPAVPAWAKSAPLDPRSCIQTPVFKNLDPRIPRISIPRIDLAVFPAAARGVQKDILTVSPIKRSMSNNIVSLHNMKTHDRSTCWICKSSKSPERKRALHRYQEKRKHRNWKRGPRYTGRSSVATNRVRNGGRFVCTTRWV